MTNEAVTVSGALLGRLSEEMARQVSQGHGLADRLADWVAQHGISYAFNVVTAVVMLLVGWLAIKAIRHVLTKVILKKAKKPTLFSTFMLSVVTKSCWAFLIVMVLGRLGVNVGPLIAGLGITGFILGFAFQESLGNLASGLMIAINEPFKAGDYVAVAGHEGTVLKVDMMATVLATADNKKVVIPNKSAWGSPITNFSSLGTRRVDLCVGIAYGSDVAKAIRIASETVAKVPGVLADPAPSVFVASLDDSAVTLNVRPWSTVGDYWSVHSAAYQAVKKAFEDNAVDIPFPQLVVHSDR